MKLAEISGEIDTRKSSSKITREQFNEWWAYGYLIGWFDRCFEQQDKNMMPIEEAQKFLAMRQ